MRVFGLPDEPVSMRVPLTPENEILLGSTGTKPESMGRIQVAKVNDILSISRDDGDPIQVSFVYEKHRQPRLGIDSSPVMSRRAVLLSPIPEVILREVDEDTWITEQAFSKPEHGPGDFEKFIRKVALESLKKSR